MGIENALIRDSDVTLNQTDRVNKIKSLIGIGSDVIVVLNYLNVESSIGKFVDG